MDNEGSLSNKCRSHTARLGTLTVALGIGTVVATGLGAAEAHADTYGSSSSRAANDPGVQSTTDSNPQGRGRSSRTKPAQSPSSTGTAPSAKIAASRHAAAALAAAASQVALPSSPAALPPPVLYSKAAPEFGPANAQAVTEAKVSAPRPAPATAAEVISPPIASVSLAKSVSNLLTSLSNAFGGPVIPADGALTLMVGARRREVDAALSPMAAKTKVAAETATSSSTATVIEGEQMRVVSGSGRVVADRWASSGYVVALSGSGTVSAKVTLPASSALTFRVRSTAGAPNMTVAVDGVVVTTVLVNTTSYTDYTFAGGITAGSHVITVSSTTATTRNKLYIDALSNRTGPIVDEFVGTSGSAPGNGMWSVRAGTNFDGGQATYSADNAFLDGHGNLVIQATRGKSDSYSSGWVWSKNTMSFGYGTITVRIKMPNGQALWPQVWLMGADSDTVGWPQSGEIDIVELPSTTTTVYSTLHGPIAGTTATQQAQIISNLPDLSTDYHNYWVKHLRDEITFGIDGQTLGKLTPADLAPGETWVYNRPMYMMMNLGVGGSWAGAPTSATPPTAQMLIDSFTYDVA